MSNALSTTWPSGSTNQGWPQEPTGMLMPGRIQGWPAGTQRAANPATTLLSQAVAWWDVEQYRDGDRFLRNRGTGGELLDLRLGSAAVANSNEPLFLSVEDQGYVYLSGVSGNFLSVPDENALDVTGDIDIRVRVAMDDWTPSGTSILASKRATSAFSWQFNVNVTTGFLEFAWSADGSASAAATSTAAPTVSDGSPLWVRVTLDVDNGSSQRVVTFYTSADGASWTQLGNPVTQAGTTSIFSGSAPVEIGSRSSGTVGVLAGKVYRAQVLNGIDGTTVLDVDCDAITSGSTTSWVNVLNQTVSVNRSTSGRKSVAVPSRHKGGKPVMLLGTDDFLAIPDENGWQDALTTVLRQGQSYTVMAIVRHWPTLNRSAGLIGADVQTSGVNRWNLLTTTSGGGVSFFTVDASNASAQASGSTSGGTVQTYCGVMDANSQTIYTANNGTSGAPATLKSFSGMTRRFTLNVGRWGTGNHFDGEFFGALVDRRAWSLAEIKTAADYFTGRIA